jgi:Arc/MetJ-type ribon-helix-helix transcriptional regulator
MTTKIAVSLPDELVDEARKAVKEGRADSVSGYVAEAMSQRSRRETLAALLDDLDTEFGGPGRDARRWAEQQLRRTRA